MLIFFTTRLQKTGEYQFDFRRECVTRNGIAAFDPPSESFCILYVYTWALNGIQPNLCCIFRIEPDMKMDFFKVRVFPLCQFYHDI